MTWRALGVDSTCGDDKSCCMRDPELFDIDSCIEFILTDAGFRGKLEEEYLDNHLTSRDSLFKFASARRAGSRESGMTMLWRMAILHLVEQHRIYAVG